MDPDSPELHEQLKAFKQAGMTFYQATERLKQQGYTSAQIAEAVDSFDYTTSPTEPAGLTAQAEDTVRAQPNPKPGSELDKSYQKLGNELLEEKERHTRPFVYIALVVPSAYLAMKIYDFWLNRKFWASHGDRRYLSVNNLGKIYLVGAIGAVIAIVGLKIYFHSKNNRYKKIAENLHKSAPK